MSLLWKQGVTVHVGWSKARSSTERACATPSTAEMRASPKLHVLGSLGKLLDRTKLHRLSTALEPHCDELNGEVLQTCTAHAVMCRATSS